MEEVEATRTAEWNNNFLKYVGKMNYVTDNGKEMNYPIPVTAHDIITIANFARQNNVYYDYDPDIAMERNNSLTYIQVAVNKGANVSKAIRNLESCSDRERADFLNKYSVNVGSGVSKPIYFLVSNCEISTNTKRVIYIEFTEFSSNDYTTMENAK